MTTLARILVCLVNDEAWPSDHTRSYSGGRYHALALAFAFAASGAQVDIVTNGAVACISDFERATDTFVRHTVSPQMNPEDMATTPDYVIVCPAAAPAPELYAYVNAVTARTGAVPVLINFESANWFNDLAPTPDDPRVWDPWRRTVARGGIVLSSTLEGDRYARGFYRANELPLRFDRCYPPINSAAADSVGTPPKDGGVFLFARPYHDYKGGADVLDIPPGVFRDRTLRAVFGGEPHHGYVESLRTHLVGVPGARVEVHSRITDEQKYALLARSQALLFPSRFEGYGYPPVEAAYAGTEIACYDLPVLAETVGSIAHMARLGDAVALGDALERALAMPERRDVLRTTVSRKMSLPAVSEYLRELVSQWRTECPPNARAYRDYAVVWGPWPDDPVDEGVDSHALPPLPPQADVVQKGDLLEVTVTVWTASPVVTSALRFGNDAITGVCTRKEVSDAWTCNQLHFRLSDDFLDRKLTLSMQAAGSRVGARAEHILVRRAG